MVFTEMEIEEKARYLIGKENKGNILCKKFHSISNINESEIRPTLGDFVDARFSILHELALFYFYPMSSYELYRAGTLLGYSSISEIKKNFPNENFSDGDIFKILHDSKIKEWQVNYWKSKKIGIPNLSEIDIEKRILLYAISETLSSLIDTLNPNQKFCFFNIGILNAQLQVFSDHYCNPVEEKCAASRENINKKESCYFKIFVSEDKERIVFQMYDKENLEKVIESLIDSIVSDNENKVTEKREKLGSVVHISINQSVNYLLLSISKGHLVLSKFAGKKIGELIAEKSKQDSLISVLDYLNNLFIRLKIGIIETELTPDCIRIKMKESLYSAGVENIGITLCAFIAGIVNGMLNKATNVKWIVREVQCLANGDEECEFLCQTENPETLKHLLLG